MSQAAAHLPGHVPIAAFPMYDYPELTAVHDALWVALHEALSAAGVVGLPSRLTRDLSHFDLRRHPRLLLGQACEYPLATSCAGYVRLVATPRYTVPGCDGSTLYRSAIVVRATDQAETLADLRGRRCIVNERDSNSGMNLLRAAIAPVSGGARFFGSVSLSGSHRGSVAAVAAELADVAAVDGVSFAHFRKLDPPAVTNLRVLCWTPPSPCPPFVTAAATSDSTLAALRGALAKVSVDPRLARVRESLFLEGLDLQPDDRFVEVLSHERRAAELGYTALL
jgi:ABC-type phosphate/phosphonate transport system substrate-binding protein